MSKKQQIEQTEFMHIIDEESKTGLEWHERRDLELELMKLARSYQRLQEADCNYGLSPRQQTRERNIEKRIRAIVERLGLSGVKFSGDPRGYTVKIVLPSGKTNNWGQEGYCVPTF